MRRGSDGPAPIPPPRRNRAKKSPSNPAGGTPVLPPPAPSSRSNRRSQEGQLINIDDSSRTTPTRPVVKPIRTFPSPLGGAVDSTDSGNAPLINVMESPSEGLPKSPSASRLFDISDSDSDEQGGSSGHLDASKSLKGSNSSPNLITYGEEQQQQHSQTLVDTFTSSGPSAQSSGNTSPHNMFSDSFTPTVSSTTQVLSSQPSTILPSQLSASVAPPPMNPLNPFSDSFVPPPMSTVTPTTTSAMSPRKNTSLPAVLSSPVPLAPQTATPSFMSNVPLQPLQPTSAPTRSKSESEAPKDPFADLVSMQLKGKIIQMK